MAKKAKGGKKASKKKANPLSTGPMQKEIGAWIKRARKAMGKFPELGPKVTKAEKFAAAMECADDEDGHDFVPIKKPR